MHLLRVSLFQLAACELSREWFRRRCRALREQIGNASVNIVFMTAVVDLNCMSTQSLWSGTTSDHSCPPEMKWLREAHQHGIEIKSVSGSVLSLSLTRSLALSLSVGQLFILSHMPRTKQAHQASHNQNRMIRNYLDRLSSDDCDS